jgi:thioredoxin-dependent peroxiredoxin
MTTQLTDGDAAPPFTLPDADGKNVSLADFPGQRVIVYFYPAALTPGCTTQAIDFTAAIDELRAAGLHVIGISPDAQERLIQFREQESVGFPLLSDPDRSTLNAYGAYGEKLLYGKLIQGVIRSTFVIDVDQKGHGTVAVAQYNVKATGHVEKLKRDLHLKDPR